MQKIYPFKFLDSYKREDKDFFFGRDEEIEALYQMSFQAKILLVYGTSGTGKTSLIQCGLANKFQSYDWSALFVRRGENLVNSFDKILCEETEGVFPEPAERDNSIKSLAEKIEAVYNATFKPIYLIFDQFEELYILGDLKEQKGFFKIIREILTLKRPVKIIISIREEYLGYLYEFEREVPELLRKKLRVEPMNLDKVKSVVQSIGNSPTGSVSLEKGFEDQIANSIFEKIKGDEKTLTIQLPYLQVFLDNLYLKITKDESRKAPAVFTTKALNEIGDIGDVLRNFLDEQVMNTSQKLEQKPETIWKILSPFVTLDGTKEPISANQLTERFEDEPKELINAVIQAFVKSRILRFTEKDNLYEISHDSLAKQVNAKRSDEEIAILEVQRLIKSQVSVKPEAREFFTEKQLLFIEPYLEKFKESDEEADWIEKSRKNVEKQKRQDEIRKEEDLSKARKRNRTLAGFLIIALLACVVAGIFWNKANKQNKELELAIEQQKIAIEQMKIAKTIQQRAELERYKALESAKLAKDEAISSKNKAQENLYKMYEAEKQRYLREIDILNKNIRSFKEYGAGNDIISDENQKIDALNKLIKDLDKEMMKLEK